MNISPAKKPRRGGRIFKGCAVLTMAGVIGIAALLGSLWLEHRTEVTLPAPTGPFAVGRSLYDWTDATAPDTLAPVAGTRRELLVWIWYPSAAGERAAMEEYLPAPMRTAAGEPVSILRLLTRDPSKVHSHSHRDSAVSPRQRSYPVVIMRAGASAEVVKYSTLAEDLASHGYIVVGLDAPIARGASCSLMGV
jgi:predicted dienelactone hydrolase